MTTEQRRDLRFTHHEVPDPRPLDAVPPWFTAAITTPYDTGSVEVDGVTIAYRAWGDPDDPVVLLVHGGGANAVWWDHVAPLLSAGRRVVAARSGEVRRSLLDERRDALGGLPVLEEGLFLGGLVGEALLDRQVECRIDGAHHRELGGQ